MCSIYRFIQHVAVIMKGKKQLSNVFIACVVVRRRWIKLSTSLPTTIDELMIRSQKIAKNNDINITSTIMMIDGYKLIENHNIIYTTHL